MIASKFKDIIDAKKKLDEEAKTFLCCLKDKSIPLDQRWEIYTIAVQNHLITKNDRYGDGHSVLLFGQRGSPYDDFYMERGNTKDYIDILEMYEDDPEEPRWEQVTPERLIAWKEHILSLGEASFTYDW